MGTEGMNARWKRFAEKVAEGTNATEAYLEGGYKPARRESAQTAASRLRHQPAVRAYIRDLREAIDECAREDTHMSLSRTLAHLVRIVETSAATLAEDDPLLEYARTYKDGTTAKRMPSKLQALRMHAQLAGHYDRPRQAPVPAAAPMSDLLRKIHNAPREMPPRTDLAYPPDSPANGWADTPLAPGESRPLDPTLPISGVSALEPPRKPLTPEQTITSTPPGEEPRVLSARTLELQRRRASWTPSTQPYPYPDDCPGVFNTKPRVTIVR